MVYLGLAFWVRLLYFNVAVSFKVTGFTNIEGEGHQPDVAALRDFSIYGLCNHNMIVSYANRLI